MGLISGALSRLIGLPPPVTRSVRSVRDLRVPMRDGTVLRADLYSPALPEAPTVLIRTPYGRRGGLAVAARTAAEQGFHVLVQSCRGTMDSDGVFTPLRQEHDDGLDTLAWLRERHWYNGELCLYGPSYVGYTQWAMAADSAPDLKAMAAVVTASQFRDPTYAGGAFSLDSVLTWAELMEAQRVPSMARRMELWRGQPGLRRGLSHLPLAEADEIATGAEVAFVKEWLAHGDPDDPYWAALGHGHRIGEITAEVLLIAGWYDIFLPWQLADFQALRAAGARPRLVVGTWTHGSVGLHLTGLREAIRWFHAHTGRSAAKPDHRVRVQVGGGVGWIDLPEWPPPGVIPRPWYLGPDGALRPSPSPVDGSDGFRYDPADPTPALAGPRLVAKVAGRKDNSILEARPDVLVYTSEPLAEPMDAIGPVSAEVYVHSELEHYDVFVRVCDVDPAGRSWNICDGLVRLTPGTAGASGSAGPVRVELWPMAYRFRAGHRIRVQISGGAHPRWARNPGTGEPLGTAVELIAGQREIRYGPDHPSRVTLPSWCSR